MKSVRLGDVVDDVTVGFVGPMASEYVEQGVLFLRSQDVLPYRLATEDVRRITPEFHARLKKSSLQPGDVVVVRTGKPGTAAVIPEGLGPANCSDLVIVRPGPLVDPDYLCSFINGVATHQIHSRLVGAVQQHFNVGAARQLELPLPPIKEQRRVAKILTDLDDKIEVNRRMAATLEELARTVFRSWFVDFDPVRAKASAKAEGRDLERAAMAALSGRDEGDLDALPPETLASLAATAALFPDDLALGEHGLHPNGWRFAPLTEACWVTMGQSPPGDTYNDTGEGLPFYQGRADFQKRFPKRRVYCASATRFANEGDTLMSVRAPVGDLNIASEPCAIGRGVGAFRHRSDSRAYTFSLLDASSQLFESFDSEGTVFGSVSKKDLERLHVLEPTPELIKAYEELAGGMDKQLLNLHRESTSLAALRDVLLPKLLSGELNPSPVEEELAHA